MRRLKTGTNPSLDTPITIKSASRTDSTIAQDVVLLMGVGDDTVVISGNTIGRDLAVDLSFGDDTFDATGGGNSVGRRTVLFGGPGVDSALGLDDPTNAWGNSGGSASKRE